MATDIIMAPTVMKLPDNGCQFCHLPIGLFSRRTIATVIQEAGLYFDRETRKTLQLNTVLAKMQTDFLSHDN